MIYEYECDACRKRWDVWKPVAEFNTLETCECGGPGRRRITGGAGFIGAKVEDAAWHPALGQVVRNTSHARALAKERGMIEVGNESPDKIDREMTATREAIRERRYDEALR